MARYCKIRPQAERDLDECAAYIAQDNLAAALRLYDAVQQTCQNLLRRPVKAGGWGRMPPTALRRAP